jgi:predicted Fe-Mo cluster-binding NifX family protein
MRIAVSTETEGGLTAPVAAHFGRCPFFTIVEMEGETIKSAEPIKNPYFPQHEPGSIPKFIKDQDVEVMLAGGMGRRAVAFFEEFNIHPVTGASGTVQQGIEALLRGELAGAEPCLQHLHIGRDGQEHEHC